jgi:murein DD-endopeptidase MepM/ murein hydrolase activator NlpD
VLLALGVVALFTVAAALSPDPAPDPAGAVVQASNVARATPTPTIVPARTTAPTPTSAPTPTVGPHGDDVSAADVTQRQLRTLVVRSRRPPAPPIVELTGYRWPLDHATLTNGYGRGRPGSLVQNGRPFHDGIDIATWCGDRITAAHDGEVIAVGRKHLRAVGWLGDLSATKAEFDRRHLWSQQAIAVVINDGNGYRSIYLHLGYATVEVGEHVKAGQLIGYEGSTGYSTGCHLHYSLFSPLERATLALDPELAKTSHLPDHMIARINPLAVLPPLESADIVWGWNAR